MAYSLKMRPLDRSMYEEKLFDLHETRKGIIMKTATKNRFERISDCNYLSGWLLCGAMAFSGFLSVSASETVPLYAIEGATLKITVPEGVTNEVDVSEVECANNNEVTKIQKLGRGGFLMNDKTAFPNYTGDIYVNEGTWIVACTNALGKLDSGKGENTGKVFVADGATIDMASTDRFISNSGKKITIKGDGVSGNGALTVSVKASDYYKNVLGNNIVLEDDASIGMTKSFNLYFLNSIINLNGHKLTVKGDDGKGNIVVGGSTGSTVESGVLEFDGYGSLLLQDKTLFSEGSSLLFNGNSEVTFKMYGRYEAPLVWNSNGKIVSSTTPNKEVVTNRNTWHGPVRLDKNMGVALSSSGTFGLMGPVSGSGGLDIYWNANSKPEVPTNFVNFANADSSFEGGVSVKDLVANVMEDGAVPADGGVFALTNSIVNFESLKNYTLPDGIIHVDGDGERSVSGGMGKWKTLVKTGSGTVNYNSAIGAEELDLREGVLKVSVLPAAMYAGLIEGVEYFSDGNDSINAALNAEIAYTNGIVMSPYLMNSAMKSYWTTFRPDWDVETQTIKGHCTTYTGYMWNRESTNVMWTFVSCVANRTVLHIDNEQVIYHTPNSTAKTLGKATVEVTPGAHRFRIANHSSYHSNNPLKTEGGMSGSVPEWKGMGLRWDPFGRGTTNHEDFVILEDPGDGSLFTWAVPGEDVYYPGMDESVKLGKFRRVKFSGGTLHLNGTTNWISEVQGIPNVAGSGKMIIENKWTVDAADIVSGSKASGLSFAFGEDVELIIDNPLAAKNSVGVNEWTIVESLENITGSISIKDEVASEFIVVKIVGNTVKLKRRPGTVMVIR